ncbi:CvpA family protein [Rickettsiales endosymbiont of Peranema trichophorum]|uniref:CvpA family protein n=1 Tax=Rickettsiales endosymbiont of Peranema trichophorum TaxID=2486577 RepID=UPI00102349A8|nr:CvpA family protein [Rickettsiales endosymbiont of Peranema trichophorum]RZI47542.1 CvpA family protein [Rickettsiales endosymbiont of Peranema trichophorum]
MTVSGYNLLDVIVYLVIALSTLFGFFRGLIASLLSLFGWAVSIYATYRFGMHLQAILAKKLGDTVAGMISYSTIMILLLIVFGILNGLVIRHLLVWNRGILNKLFGMIFGFCRGCLIVSLFYLSFSIAISLVYGTSEHDENRTAPKLLTTAHTYPQLKIGKELLLGAMGPGVQNKLHKLYADITKKSQEERLVSYYTHELYKYMNPQEQKHIDALVAKSMTTHSQLDTEMETLQELLKLYNQKYADIKLQDRPLSQENIKTLESILESHHESLESNQEGEGVDEHAIG